MKFFKTEVHPLEIEHKGEKLTFFVRDSNGEDFIAALDLIVDGKVKNSEGAKGMLNLVVHEDGTPLTDEEASQLRKMPNAAVGSLIFQIQKRVEAERDLAVESAKKGSSTVQ